MASRDPDPPRAGHLGLLVAGASGTGLLVALLLATAPFIPATESGVTGALLLGFACGWAVLAVLSGRFSHQPQRWAAAPAAFMGAGALLLLAFGAPVLDALAWVWPPALLQRAGEPGPYVLAGHSFGGLYALTFVADHPDEVAGLVLIDSTAPALHPATGQVAPSHPDDTMKRISASVALGGRLGLGGLVGADSPGHLRSTVDEYLLAGFSMDQAAALGTFEDKPLVVLTADRGTGPGWAASQDALAALSNASVHRVVDGATHSSLIDDEQDAAQTARWILDAVTAVRERD